MGLWIAVRRPPAVETWATMQDKTTKTQGTMARENVVGQRMADTVAATAPRSPAQGEVRRLRARGLRALASGTHLAYALRKEAAV